MNFVGVSNTIQSPSISSPVGQGKWVSYSLVYNYNKSMVRVIFKDYSLFFFFFFRILCRIHVVTVSIVAQVLSWSYRSRTSDSIPGEPPHAHRYKECF